MRAGLVPVFVDVEPDTYNIDVDASRTMIGPRTRALLIPNLIGNVPDWDRIREIADRHDLLVIEDSCDALGSTLRGTPTGTRPTSRSPPSRSRTSSPRGTGGMVVPRRRRTRRPLPAAAALGPALRGADLRVTQGRRRVLLDDRRDIEYDNLFIFDEIGWNFEPSELSAAFGLVQLDKLPEILAGASATSRSSASVRPIAPTSSRSRAPLDGSTPRGTCSRS